VCSHLVRSRLVRSRLGANRNGPTKKGQAWSLSHCDFDHLYDGTKHRDLVASAIVASISVSVSATTAAAAIPTAATTTTTTTTTGARRTWTGFIDFHVTAADCSAVKIFDCFLGMFAVGHFDKSETP
jgi:hypothetical protein